MQNRHSLLWLAIAFFTSGLQAQTTYLPLWAKEGWLLDRMEIKAQKDNNLNLSAVKPYMRKAYVAVGDSFRRNLVAGNNSPKLSHVDQYNLARFLNNNKEYRDTLVDSNMVITGQLPVIPQNFRNRPNMLEVNQPNFFLSLNPAISVYQGIESDYDEALYFRSFGATLRGLIGKKIGFQALATANNESGPVQFRQFVQQNSAVPGANSFEKEDNKTVSYADLRGSVSWNVTPYINMQFGRDQQFIGDGYRSLFLSNFSAPHTFLKFNTRIWKLNYTNLYMQLSPTPDAEINKGFLKKYTSMHHLSVNVTKWLTVGGFEAIVFGRENHYDYSYLLPVIFLRSIEQQNGSPDNANLGIDFKANVLKKVQLYGQLMFDEFKKDELVGESSYWWGNKQAYQLGAKYVDAFGVANLDLQAEFNQVRPFMYQFRDTTAAYTHALQPLAHPIGGNLREITGILRYQPMPRLYLYGRLNVWRQGLDSAGYNFGSNPNALYTSVAFGGTRLREDNYPMFAGMPVDGINGAVTASYELLENFFAEGSASYRSYKETDMPALNTTAFSFGFRWNMFRRDYDY
jgi:hypothetical protein